MLRAIFTGPGLANYSQQIDSYDPADLAGQLPASLPALVVHGALDGNVTGDEIQHLLGGFAAAGNQSVVDAEFPDVDHELRQVPAGQPPSLTVSYPFSPDVTAAVTTFAVGVAAG